MWFLAPSPEALVSSIAESSIKLKNAMRMMRTLDGDRSARCSDAAVAVGSLERELRELKFILIGDAEKEHDEDRGARAAAAAAEQHEFATSLTTCLCFLPLETQKNASHVFANLARRPNGGAFAAAIAQDSAILSSLTDAYTGDRTDFALLCGIVLREFARHEVVARVLLEPPRFWNLFTDLVRLKSFEVASIAFDLLKCLLIDHSNVASVLIKAHYLNFVLHYNKLLLSENYIICRESLRLLGELLLQRANFTTMMKYISDADNLKIVMSLLRNKKARIQVEAFHVFKVALKCCVLDPCF